MGDTGKTGNPGKTGDHYRDVSQYKYSAMSNLVLQADRRFTTKRGQDEATGDPESLAGRLSIQDLGSRVARDVIPRRANVVPGVQRGRLDEGQDILQRERRKGKATGAAGGGILAGDIEGIRYRPRTQPTKDAFNLIKTVVAHRLGDLPDSFTISVTDAIIEYLKDDDLKDLDKKKEVERALGESMSAKEFNELVNLGKKLTDYDAQDDEDMADANMAEDEIDGRQGVAVNFENEEEDDGMVDVVRDESSDDEEEDEVDGVDEEAAVPNGDEEIGESGMEGETMVIDSEAQDNKGITSIPARDIDAFWLQRTIGTIYKDPHIQHEKTTAALHILSGEADESGGDQKHLRDVENEMMELLDYENHEVVQLLIENREKIVWLTRLAKAGDKQEREQMEGDMVAEGLRWILDELQTKEGGQKGKLKMDIKMDVDPNLSLDAQGAPKQERHDGELVGDLQPRKLINLDNLVFDAGPHLMTNAKVRLPQGTTKRSFKGYEEIHVPAPKKHANIEQQMPVSSLPSWAQKAFGNAKLNYVQTKVYGKAFHDDGNLLICAPTGSGKTNAALLAVLREIGKHMDAETNELDLDAFKVVWLSPLKALVAEQVGNLGKRLGDAFGIKVSELTGDSQLSKQAVSETQVIVATPEKWDVITRKASDLSYTNLVTLIVIDEIHLLHDTRGPVLESIVARTMRRNEIGGEPVRIVGLSATLPNFVDVGAFLRCEKDSVFHFDASFRPCPLRQEFIGITDRKAIKQLQTMNDICYTKTLENTSNSNQLIIFVHSRKDTGKTAKWIRDKCLDEETISRVLRRDAGTREILNEASASANNADLKDLLPYGFGIHHAGLSRADRQDVEDLFAQGALSVLVSTATLAWGVNLPAHTVIIKGTQVYSPEKGSWVELSPQDILQMLGRAGRPQYDTYGEGIIITTQSEIQYYLSLLNQQLPIESQMASKLVDSLNAEIVLGNVRTRDEAVDWLGYTYFFIRMLRSPGLYSVGADYQDDPALEQRRVDLVHSAAHILKRAGLCKYDEKAGKLQSTPLGRIASHYYLSYGSVETYNKMLQPSLTDIELLRVFAASDEFRYIPCRQEEKLELAKLLTRVPIPVKESVDEATAKISVLLQAYISRLKLEGLALMADMVYVTQSAGRLLRAIFEIALIRGWAVAKLALRFCQMAEKRLWPTYSPLRQFPNCPVEIVRKAERVDIDFSAYYDLDPPRMAELLGIRTAGKTVCTLVAKFPRLTLHAQCQPLTRSLLRIELTITPNFTWDEELHGQAEAFWIVVEDGDGDSILFHDLFILRKDLAGEDDEHMVDFTVAITEPMPPAYFVSLISDRWMHADTRLTLPFQKLILPDKFPPHTDLLDMQPLPVSALKAPDFISLYPQDWENFNKIQTQTFNSLHNSDDNVLVCAPTGAGKTVCAEFAILRHFARSEGKAVYIAPFQELVDQRLADWQTRFAGLRGGKHIVKLTGETSSDLKLLELADLMLATPEQWDSLSRPWNKRKNLLKIVCFICDELHMLAQNWVYENVVARMHFIRSQRDLPMRIVGLSVAVANARDIADWIDCKKQDTFSFSPHVRPVPLELHIQSFSIPHFPSLMLAMAKPTYLAITQMSAEADPVMVFVSNRRQTRATARDLLAACLSDGDPDRFLHVDVQQIKKLCDRVSEEALAEALSHGLGYMHEALSETDKRIVLHLYKSRAIKLLVVSRDICWEIDSRANLVVLMGTQAYDGQSRRYVDYPVADVLTMFGKATQAGRDGRARAVIMLPAVKREYWKKFINEAVVCESQLHNFLPDALLAEIAAKTVGRGDDAIEWTTRTLFYRRLLANPSYYGLTARTSAGLANHLTDLITCTLKELADAKIVELDEEDEDAVQALDAAVIANFYNISYITMQTLLLSLNQRTKLKGILEIVTSATEFESIQIRRHDESLLRRIYDNCPVKMSSEPVYDSPHFKAFVLVQAHWSRMDLPIDLAKDQEVILRSLLNHLSAIVDVLSSEGHLNAIHAMEMSQMVVQAMWDRDSPLKQLPHFGPEQIKVANRNGVKDVLDFMDKMGEPDSMATLTSQLDLSNSQLATIANFTNSKYPEVEMEFELLEPENVRANESSRLKISLTREIDGDREFDATVHAPFYPIKKTENWWLVVGEESTKSLLAVKRVTFGRNLNVNLDFAVTRPGKHELKLFLFCDSYVGVDQEPSFEVNAAEDMETDSSDDGEDD